MKLRTATIGFIGIFIASSMSGFLTVICHGADGHVTWEPAVHNHCSCPDKNTDSRHKLSENHEHCTDIISSTAVFYPKKNNTFQRSKLLATKILLNQDLFLQRSLVAENPQSVFETEPFHTPLRTVVLLA